MLRNDLKTASAGWIASGKVNLTDFQTLGEIQRRLLSDQSALRELIADGVSPLNIDAWQRDLALVESDLQQVNQLIGQYGEWTSLA